MADSFPVEAHAAAGWRRLTRAWCALARDQRLAAVAAFLLLATMLLPWYEETFSRVIEHRLQIETVPKTALFVLSWVEAAVLLVCLSVLALLFARAERRPFHLPGGDGLMLTLAGGWTTLLVVWRLFDRPDLGDGVSVGIAWGIFVALAAALLLGYAGLRVRAAHRPEPAMPGERRRPESRRDATTVLPDERPHLDRTQVLERGGDDGPAAPPSSAAPPS